MTNKGLKLVQNIFKVSLIFIFSLILTGKLEAQVATNYSFTQAAGAPTYLTAGYTEHTTGTTDEDVYNSIPIGFTFSYNCQNYTTVGISSNGFIVFRWCCNNLLLFSN